MSKPKNHTVERLRPEGVSLTYDQLNESQREAFRRLTYTMNEAVDNLGVDPKQSKSFRPNNVMFISGARGTGKTCLLHSFMRYTDRTNGYDFNIGLGDLKKEGSSRRLSALHNIRNNVVWLPSIDIDPLPADFDLLTSLLVRIQRRIEAVQHRGSNEPIQGLSTELMGDLDQMYEKLLVDAAQAWKGGLIGAEDSQEPELFAVVAKSLAEANMGLSERFRLFLNEAARQVFGEGTVFVLPIDDTDLKPATGLSILKLLRMLHAPRLFVLAMGDIELFELVSSLEMMRELGLREQLDRQTLLPVKADTVRRHVSSITATAVRKLIPPDQRIELHAWENQQGLSFQPEGAEKDLKTLLGSIPIVFDDHIRPVRHSHETSLKDYNKRIEQKERKIRMRMSLHQFLFPLIDGQWKLEHESALVGFAQQLAILDEDKHPKWKTEDAESQGEKTFQYFGARVLESSARRIADLWFSLRRLDAATQRAIKELHDCEPQDRSKESLHKEMQRLQKKYHHLIETNSKAFTDTEEPHKELQLLQQQYEKIWDEILHTFKRLCRQSLMEENVLDIESREAINRAFDEHAEQVDWSRLPLTLRPTWSVGRSSTLDMRREKVQARSRIDTNGQSALELTTGATVRFYFASPKPWSVETASPQQVQQDVADSRLNRMDQFGGYKYRPISTDTAALVALYHDLVQFSHRGENFHTQFADMSIYEGLPWATTEYEIGPTNKCTLYWPAPPCVSVYGLDMFAHLWGVMTAKDKTYEMRPERFVLAWIGFGSAMVNSSTTTANHLQRLSNDQKTEREDAQLYKDVYPSTEEQVITAAKELHRGVGKAKDLPPTAPELDRFLKYYERERETQLKNVDQIERGNSYTKKDVISASTNSVLFLVSSKLDEYLRTNGIVSKEWKHVRANDLSKALPENFSQWAYRTSNPMEAIYEEVRHFRLCRRTRWQLYNCADKAIRLLEHRPDSDLAVNYREWLLNVISLTMPEFGFNGDLRRHLLFLSSKGKKKLEKDCLIRFIKMHRRAIRGRRARRLAKLVWLGLPHSAVRLAFADPNLYGKLTRLSKRGFFKAFHFVHQQHGDIQSGLLWFNDDQRIARSALDMIFDWGKFEIDKATDQHNYIRFRNGSAKENPQTPDSRILAKSLERPGQSVNDPNQSLMEVVAKAAASQSEWDSSSPEYRTQERRRSCLKRLWWLETLECHRNDAKQQEANKDGMPEVPFLSEDSNRCLMEHLDPWQEGRGLTPSIEEIEAAGQTIYGTEQWEQVSLRQLSYDLDFAEESYHRR